MEWKISVDFINDFLNAIVYVQIFQRSAGIYCLGGGEVAEGSLHVQVLFTAFTYVITL